MRVRWAALALAILICASPAARRALAEDAVAPPANLVLDGVPSIPAKIAEAASRYTESRSASFASWHPAKREMLILTRFGNTAQAHLLDHPGGARRQLTFFAEPVRWASFEPREGKFFCISRDRGGDEFYQNYRFDPATGTAALLTDGKQRNAPGLWSKKGDRFVYSRLDANEQGAFTELRVVDPSDPKSDKLLARLAGGGWGASDWSPDDSQLLAFESISANDSNIWLMDAGSGEKKLLTPKTEGQLVAYEEAIFTKDGKSMIAVTDGASEFMELVLIDLATGERKPLTKPIPWDVESVDLSDDGKLLAFTINEAGSSALRVIELESGKERALPKLPKGLIGGVRWHKNNRDLAFTLTTSRQPGDVYSIDAETGKLDRWTASETGGVPTDALPDAELVKWKSFDGREISGFLYKPPAKFEGPRPVIINIHGGPEGQSRPMFLGRSNYFLMELGVAVLFPNVRGSSGYGKTFLKLDNGFDREGSYKDIGALFDYLEGRKDIDSKRILVTGGSYGGHMTLAMATLYSDRIACSVDVVGISNLRTFLENTQAYRRDLRRVEYGDERDPKMREFLDRIAPLNHADKIKKPLFVIQGKNDPRVPISEADQIVATVKKVGTPVWYMVANDEGHGFQKKENADFQFYATVRFIEEHLLP